MSAGVPSWRRGAGLPQQHKGSEARQLSRPSWTPVMDTARAGAAVLRQGDPGPGRRRGPAESVVGVWLLTPLAEGGRGVLQQFHG